MGQQIFGSGIEPGTGLLFVATLFWLHAIVRGFLKTGIPVEEKKIARKCCTEALGPLPLPNHIMPLA